MPNHQYLMTKSAPVSSIVRLDGIGKSYQQPNKQQISILADIDLELHSGQIVALLGPSGSGKSTLMRIIAGLIAPTTGKVWYREQPMVGLNPGVAIVFQGFALYPWLTVLENVELGLKALGMEVNERRQKALKTIDIIGLDGFENAYPKELSGGMRQRVGFARALAVEPELLCMDEPFSALDVLTAENLRFELLDLWLERKIPTKSILIVTHGIEEAVILADRIIVLGRNPAKIRADLIVELPHYRDRKSPEFQALVDRVYKILTNPELEESPLPPPPTQSLQPPPPLAYERIPQVRIGSIAGLLELLEDLDEQDLYRLGQDLQLEVDDILPIVEAAKLMDLVTLNEGAIGLTTKGREFITGSIDERKQIVRERLIANVSIVQQIRILLQAKRDRKLPEELILDLLEAHFSPKEAEHQFRTAIEWGRYAELYSYDEPTGIIFLEQQDLEHRD